MKMRKCSCEPNKYFDVKVSAKNNPGRPFYKCLGCGAFDWIAVEEMMMADGNQWSQELQEDNSDMANTFAKLKDSVEAFVKFGEVVVKVVVVMYLVLVICVMLN